MNIVADKPDCANSSRDEFTTLPTPPTLPAALRPLLEPWLVYLLSWVSAYLYRVALLRAKRDPLVLLARSGYDLSAVVKACAGFHHQSGPGAPPTYSVDTLVRAEIVRLWAGSCSDPALERLIAVHLIARWFCRLPLLGSTPDHATLARFHAWMSANAPASFFSDTLAFIDQVDPEDPATTPQIVDTFALATPAASKGAIKIMIALATKAIHLWQACAPTKEPDPLASLDLTAITAPKPAYNAKERSVALSATVIAANALLTALRPAILTLPTDKRAELEHYLNLLAKVIADETKIDDKGKVTERAVGKKGSFRLGSAVDTEATFRKHDDNASVLGYNAAISTTTTRIRAAVALSGCTPDSVAPIVLLEQEKEAGQPLPAELIMDRAGGWGKTRFEVAEVSAELTQMVALIPTAGGADSTRFGPADFTLSEDKESLTCPNGVTINQKYKSGEGDGVHFRFLAKDCEGCPLKERCRLKDADPAGHRSVYISPYQDYLVQAQEFNQTEKGKELLKTRWRVEATIAWIVRYDGCREARRYGQAAAQFHLFQACAIRNLWRWLARGAPGSATQTLSQART